MKYRFIVGVVFILLSSFFFPKTTAVSADNRYSIVFDGSWTNDEISFVLRGARDVGDALARVTLAKDDPDEAFQAIYHLSPERPMVFYKPSSSEKMGGFVRDTRHITVFGFYPEEDLNRAEKSKRLIVHELGHAFEDAVDEMVGEKLPRQTLLLAQSLDNHFPDRVSKSSNNWSKNLTWGYAGLRWEWQQSADTSPAEEFADMFLGWTYSAWGSGESGYLRKVFMDVHMPSWVHIACEQYY